MTRQTAPSATDTAETACAVGIVTLAAALFVGTSIWSFVLLGSSMTGF
ncbi:MAG: hypothetical protein NW205_02140 [Hyphomicrobiaceae bacterium]|nr:hypothetical protein [Hyphomicrobiaceae bacterium]